VGALAASLAALSGADGCAPSAVGAVGPVDRACYHLVWTLSERVGLVAAAFTAVLVLTAVGLSHTAIPTEAGGEKVRR
jgi:hypothetical protein